ncbi:hypothetical protein EB796_015467 [Bugula neritina]|uniref:Uncharacterized protein n=1 Tax=Bugula neritina TaxID=10212 RepID=A0A7J7JIS2_BUGNE|nr:hypothetical protein EB796_015467 [Bugula neritina]
MFRNGHHGLELDGLAGANGAVVQQLVVQEVDLAAYNTAGLKPAQLPGIKPRVALSGPALTLLTEEAEINTQLHLQDPISQDQLLVVDTELGEGVNLQVTSTSDKDHTTITLELFRRLDNSILSADANFTFLMMCNTYIQFRNK